MEIIQKLLDENLQKVPRWAIAKVITEKLPEQKATSVSDLADEIADYILSGSKEPFSTFLTTGNEHLKVTFADEDLAKVEQILNRFFETGVESLLHCVSEDVPEIIADSLEQRWEQERALQAKDISDFRDRLEVVWAKPLNELRMLLTICREWCSEHVAASAALDAKSLMNRLFARGLQVADEIICLLENGFADGAMARWRTLHEISVVAAVLAKFGDDIATRYIAHQSVDSMKALRKYQACYASIGYDPIPQPDVDKINSAYQAAITRFGGDFKSDYGWAAVHLRKHKPTFADLEMAAGFSEMRSHYQMANMNVHAGVKSMFVRLGLLENFENSLLAGRSNVGLTEPGQNAAHSLARLAATVCLPGETVDDMVVGTIIMRLRDRIPRSFADAEMVLRKRCAEQDA
jgi:Family of unknown function (DUF5677)